MQIDDFFAALWRDYLKLAPQAAAIRQLFGGEHVMNDHIAFRTFAQKGIALEDLELPLLALGYRRDAPYAFPEKHLSAWGYVPDNPADPLVFLSQLHVEQLPVEAQEILAPFLAPLKPAVQSLEVFFSGRHWPAPSWAQYQALLAHSEYAAWLLVHGFHANHFTIAMHHAGVSLEKAVDTLLAEQYLLNEAGGIIKGSREELLKQAATLAQKIPLQFADGVYEVTGCYYEFAERFHDARGQLYQGFVAASANRIFESTNQATR